MEYVAGRGDSPRSVGSRFGVEPSVLARDNGLAADARLTIGQRLVVDNRHVIPPVDAPIVINVAQRMLFLQGGVVAGYPVGVGRADWQTPLGQFTVDEKRINSTASRRRARCSSS